MERTKIYKALKASSGEKITVCGWVRSFRANRFIALNDGSCLSSLQVVIDFENTEQQILDTISVGASISVSGQIIESQGSGQKIELQAHTINVIGTANPEEVQKTILQPKKHNLETLREQAHLRFRTNLFGAVFRIRHHMSFAVHNYFNQKGYFYIHTPIIT